MWSLFLHQMWRILVEQIDYLVIHVDQRLPQHVLLVYAQLFASCAKSYMLQFVSLLMSFKDAIVYLSPFSSNHYMLSEERDIISGNRIRLSLFSALLLPSGGCACVTRRTYVFCIFVVLCNPWTNLSVVVERAAVFFFLLSNSLSTARVDRSLAQIAVPVLAHVCNGSRLTCCVNIILRVNIVAIQTTCVVLLTPNCEVGIDWKLQFLHGWKWERVHTNFPVLFPWPLFGSLNNFCKRILLGVNTYIDDWCRSIFSFVLHTNQHSYCAVCKSHPHWSDEIELYLATRSHKVFLVVRVSSAVGFDKLLR